jgi:CheY-like chemotaxis protein
LSLEIIVNPKSETSDSRRDRHDHRTEAGRVNARAGSQPSATAVDKSGVGKRILVIEDHLFTRLALLALLRNRGYETDGAESVQDARDLASRNRYDLVISDIGLPDGDGNELMAEFRRLGLKGIAVTGLITEEDVERCQKAGFLAHVSKPVRVQVLDEALNRALQGT